LTEATVTDGIPMLLWCCPVCQAHDALIHRDGWFRAETVFCVACHTTWRVDRMVGQDYRLTITAGRPDLVGTSRALADWYDQVKASFRPVPIDRRLSDPLPDEVVYLTAVGIPLITNRSNPLFAGWPDQEAPRESRLRPDQPADWATLGTGRLDLTGQRLVWDDERRRCDLWWRRVNTIFTYFRTTFGVMYGRAVYRFQFTDQSILKWLTYAVSVARPIATAEGRSITATHF
jgi:hypothetical protein